MMMPMNVPMQGAGSCNASEVGEAHPGWFADVRGKTSHVCASLAASHLYDRQQRI